MNKSKELLHYHKAATHKLVTPEGWSFARFQPVAEDPSPFPAGAGKEKSNHRVLPEGKDYREYYRLR
jgi:hypothetical protein